MLDRIPAVVIVCAVAVICVLVSGKMSPSRPDISLVQSELPLPSLPSAKLPVASKPTLGVSDSRPDLETGTASASPAGTSQPAPAVSRAPSVPDRSTLTPTTRPASRIGVSLPARDRNGRRALSHPVVSAS